MIGAILKKAISVFLVFAMVLEVASSSCYALDPEEKTISPPESVEDPCETTGIFSSAVIGESVSRRSEHAKGFRLKDGSDAVFLYPFSVYEKNEDGVLIEIDNTLVAGQDPVGDHVYVSNSVSKKTVIYKYPSSGRFLDLDTKEGSISWGF